MIGSGAGAAIVLQHLAAGTRNTSANGRSVRPASKSPDGGNCFVKVQPHANAVLVGSHCPGLCFLWLAGRHVPLALGLTPRRSLLHNISVALSR